MRRILIVGLGSIAKKHIKTLKLLYPQVELHVVSSNGNSQIKESPSLLFCKDITQAINYSPDFALVASPATFHFTHTKTLLNAGIPVLVEKPLTADSQEAKELVELAIQTQVPVKVAYCLRYLSSAKRIKNVLSENKIGPIYNVIAHVGQYLPTWRQDKDYRNSVSASNDLGGGVLLELSHELDYLQWLLGPLTYNYSLLRHTKELALEVEEIADIFLTTETGTVCTVHMNFIQKKPQRYCYFLGEKGHIYWNLMDNSISFHSDKKDELIYDGASWDRNKMYQLMIEDFVEQVRLNQVNIKPLISAYKIVELITQIKNQALWGITQ